MIFAKYLCVPTHIISVLNLFWKYYVSIFLRISGGGGGDPWRDMLVNHTHPASARTIILPEYCLLFFLFLANHQPAHCQLSPALSAPLLGPLSQYLTFLPLGNLRSEKNQRIWIAICQKLRQNDFCEFRLWNLCYDCGGAVKRYGLLLYLSLPHPL